MTTPYCKGLYTISTFGASPSHPPAVSGPQRHKLLTVRTRVFSTLNSRAPGAAESDRTRRAPPLALGRGKPAGIHQAQPRRGPGRPLADTRGLQQPPAALLLQPGPTLRTCSACNAHLSAEASTDAPQLVQDVEALAEGVVERGPQAQSGSRRSVVTDDSNPNSPRDCLIACTRPSRTARSADPLALLKASLR